MNLAYSLDSQYMTDINNYAQPFVDNLIKFDLYKDCRDFVNFINNQRFFTLTILMLEWAYITQFDEDVSLNFEYFNELLNVLEKKVEDVKKYPDKKLKEKFMRINKDEMESFQLLKIRYSQIIGDIFPEITEEIKRVSDKGAEKSKLDTDAINSLNFAQRYEFCLGLIYGSFMGINADILLPKVKKIIKNTLAIASQFSIDIPRAGFEEANLISSKAYDKALRELAN